MNIKDTSPKDAVGVRKWRQFAVIPFTVIWELGAAMLEGARKYGRHNYRVSGVRASVYFDAALGHLSQWWEGEDIDPDSEGELHHVTKAIATLTVLRDAMIQDEFVDDRPPRTHVESVRRVLQKTVEGIIDQHPEPVEPYTERGQQCERLREFLAGAPNVKSDWGDELTPPGGKGPEDHGSIGYDRGTCGRGQA